MSYDLRIWSVEPCRDLEEHRREGKGWILNISASDPVEDEDIEDEVLPLLPGIRYLTHLHLEGDRPKAALAALHKAAKALAAAAHGAIQDPQEDSVTLPSGVTRWIPPTRDTASLSLLELTWWTERSLVERAPIEGLPDVLAAHLPEALPKRYGEYEPPAHKLEAQGRPHLVEFLVEHLGSSVVMYPHAPVAGFYVNTHRSPCWIDHGKRRAFRCHRVEISIERDVLLQPGWADGLARAWRAISVELRPFYGDVRTTHGHGRSKNGRWWSSGETEAHPIRSWWFGGLPGTLGHAAVFGEPYLSAWRDLAGHGELREDLRFVSTPDWTSGQDVADLVGGVPASHRAAKDDAVPETYPPAFPFPDRR